MSKAVKLELDVNAPNPRVDLQVSASDIFASQSINTRRALRSEYLAVKTRINDEVEDITRPESDTFELIFRDMESLHQLVRKPREQIADAEALLSITNALVSSAKALNNNGLTPSDFVLFIVKEFGEQRGSVSRTEDCRNSVVWKDIGVAVSHAFKGGPGCCTMIGPMDIEIKRKAVAQRKNVGVGPSANSAVARPEDLGSTEERTDTDKHMLIMFNILRKNRAVKLENLVLNRNSFAQTVENLFALSFLLKDGRAEIKMDEAGSQLVSPRNAPAANLVLSGEVAYTHFVFRYDFKDWKQALLCHLISFQLMVRSVRVGEELMPSWNSQLQTAVSDVIKKARTTPFSKLSSMHDVNPESQLLGTDSSPESEVLVEDSQCDHSELRALPSLKRKRKLR
ncbi:hypothetical protein L6164_034044 [Bauhinia variegata]|uniref:Uncharacterized protein n=1 Tax=Bauhinia variegata TaxID=167791 RepID=A0ACB9KUI0_BAUVA|nr:hypothetical protein L6164_034044 [Bauhinia variegata]